MPVISGKRDNAKWDKVLLKQLYMIGYEVSEILNLDKFKGLTANYLQKIVYGEKWHAERKLLRAQAQALGDIALVDKLKQQADVHLKFMVNQLEKHRELIAKRQISNTTSGQRSDLGLLSDFDQLARKTLGMDETQKAKDVEALGIQAMLQLHIHGPMIANGPRPANATEVQMVAGEIATGLTAQGGAIVPLPSNQNESLGILAQSKASQDVQAKADSEDDYIPEVEGDEKTAPEDNSQGGWDGKITGKPKT